MNKNIKYFCSKNISSRRNAEQTDATQANHKKGSVDEAPSAGGHEGLETKITKYKLEIKIATAGKFLSIFSQK